MSGAGIVDRQTEGFQRKDKDSVRTGVCLDFSPLYFMSFRIFEYVAMNYTICPIKVIVMVMCRYVFISSLKRWEFTKHIGVAVTLWNSIW
jgi:hypothetical protein